MFNRCNLSHSLEEQSKRLVRPGRLIRLFDCSAGRSQIDIAGWRRTNRVSARHSGGGTHWRRIQVLVEEVLNL
ncbi:hypothetical protein DPEC_G00369220, partial [Dallia pectoralis]